LLGRVGELVAQQGGSPRVVKISLPGGEEDVTPHRERVGTHGLGGGGRWGVGVKSDTRDAAQQAGY
jgi:hypothetical protein